MTTTITISNIKGLTLRWYHNGWHYFTFPNRHTIQEKVTTNGTQVTERFSRISRVVKATSKEWERYVILGNDQLNGNDYNGLKHILSAEIVEVYMNDEWSSVEVERRELATTTKGVQYTIEINIKLQGKAEDYI